MAKRSKSQRRKSRERHLQDETRQKDRASLAPQCTNCTHGCGYEECGHIWDDKSWNGLCAYQR